MVLCLDHRRVFLFFLFDGYGIPFSVFCQITSNPAAFRHLSFHKTEIIFLNAPFPEHFAERLERRERLPRRDDAACIPVQAVAHRWAECLKLLFCDLTALQQIDGQVLYERNIAWRCFLGQHARGLVYKDRMPVLI